MNLIIKVIQQTVTQEKMMHDYLDENSVILQRNFEFPKQLEDGAKDLFMVSLLKLEAASHPLLPPPQAPPVTAADKVEAQWTHQSRNSMMQVHQRSQTLEQHRGHLNTSCTLLSSKTGAKRAGHIRQPGSLSWAVS